MSLITCVKCGRQISDKAFACPKCRTPVESKPAVSDVSEEISNANRNSANHLPAIAPTAVRPKEQPESNRIYYRSVFAATLLLGVVAFFWNDSSMKEITTTSAASQVALGIKYRNGDGVPQDLRQAAGWFRKAADQGDAEAQNYLGLMYHYGEGAPKDYQHALALYRKAADQGYLSAQFNIGLMYDNGDGMPKDDQQALAWYRKAADQGFAIAQSRLGAMYADGDGVPKDENQAMAWLRKASDQGDIEAREKLAHVAESVANRNLDSLSHDPICSNYDRMNEIQQSEASMALGNKYRGREMHWAGELYSHDFGNLTLVMPKQTPLFKNTLGVRLKDRDAADNLLNEQLISISFKVVEASCTRSGVWLVLGEDGVIESISN